MRTAIAALAAALTVLLGAAARAQVTGDVVPRQRTLPLAEATKTDYEQSPYRLGPIRWAPEFSLDNAGYNSNVFGTPEHPVSDYTATVNLGAKLILPVGSKVYLRGTAVPNYNWYRKLASARFFGGDYGGQALAFFNRLTLSAGAETTRSRQLISTESQSLTDTRTDKASGDAELVLSGKISVFGGAERQKVTLRQPITGETTFSGLDSLDRTESAVRGGLRYRVTEALRISGEAEQTLAEFSGAGPLRDNRSKAYLLGILLDRGPLFVNLSGGYRKGEPAHGSDFVPFGTGTGSYFISYQLRGAPLELHAEGSRGLEYGLFGGVPYYIATQNGAGFSVRLGYRIAVGADGSVGRNAYPSAAEGAPGPRRQDDLTDYGGHVSILLYRKLTLVAGATRHKTSSNIGGASLSYFQFTTGLSLSGL